MRYSRIGVFFDLDHTLIDTSSGLLYYKYLRELGEVGTLDVVRVSWWMFLHWLNRLDVRTMAEREMRRYTGRPEAPIREGCAPWFERYVRPRIYEAAQRTLDAHREAGRHAVILSAASPYVCGPMRDHMGFDAILCTTPVVEDGRFTGDFVPPYCYGRGKVVWAERHAEAEGLDLDQSYFYSDSYSDLPMLERVGHPRIVNPDPKLKAVAQARGWPLLRWSHGTVAERVYLDTPTP